MALGITLFTAAVCGLAFASILGGEHQRRSVWSRTNADALARQNRH